MIINDDFGEIIFKSIETMFSYHIYIIPIGGLGKCHGT